MAGSQALGPVEEGARLKTLDVLRGVAVLGILLMNIPVMGMVGHWLKPPLPATANVDWISWLVQDTVFNGSMRGMFTLLFGAGMLLMLGQKADDGERHQAFFVRCFALIVLGVANFALFFWPGEILFAYGSIGLVLFLFRKANQRLLWTSSISLLIVVTAALATPNVSRLQLLREAPAAVAAKAAGQTLTQRQGEAFAVYEKANSAIHLKAEVHERERAQRVSFPGVLEWSATKWSWYNLEAVSLWYSADILAFMLMGMALYRGGVLTGEKGLGFYLTMAVCGYGVGLAVRGGYNLLAWRAGFEVDPNAMLARGLLFGLGCAATNLGLVGLILSVCKAGLFKGLQGVLASVGRLALTNYVGQSIITSIIFYGFGMVGQFSFAELMVLCVPIWIAQMIFSVLWLKAFTMGPLEWGLRLLTYGQGLPLLKASPKQAVETGGAKPAI